MPITARARINSLRATAAVASSEMTKLSPTNARIRIGMRKSKNNRNSARAKPIAVAARTIARRDFRPSPACNSMPYE